MNSGSLARLSLLAALSTCSFVGCTAPSASRGIPSGSAAFVRFDEPWQKDLVESTPPVYSRADRAAWREGRGVFHLTLDSQTGRVVNVIVKRSTGHGTLDAAATAALRKWRFRPGSWRQLDIPVNCEMARTRAQYLQRVREAQQHQRSL